MLRALILRTSSTASVVANAMARSEEAQRAKAIALEPLEVGYEWRSAIGIHSVMPPPGSYSIVPTALQTLADVQVIPVRPTDQSINVRGGRRGFGVGWIAHVLPFQRSASVLSFLVPTAVHAVAERQDTAANPVESGLGTLIGTQFVPFQRWATAPPLKPEPASGPPTATQKLADLQSTPASAVSLWLGGVGLIVHALPFHRSARVPLAADWVEYQLPTAVQFVLATQETALRLVMSAVAWVATRKRVQRAPSQRSAKPGPESPPVGPPTAMQNRPDVQDTPVSALPLGALGCGWMVQPAPSHRSASIQPFPRVVLPTAMQDRTDVHDTAFSTLPVAGVG